MLQKAPAAIPRGEIMLKRTAVAILIFATTFPASASKLQGTSILKDSQPIGSIDKDHKHQTYDLTFQASGREYTCRTNSDDSMNATDFIIGHEMHYEINGKKVKIKTPENKQVECKVVRVADVIAK
jgi:hypothetical protein